MRAFFADFRAEQDTLSEPSAETHSSDALLLSQWASNEYCERHKVAARHRPPRPEGVDKKIRTLVGTDYGTNVVAWKTVRAAICVPDPERHPNKVQEFVFAPMLADGRLAQLLPDASLEAFGQSAVWPSRQFTPIRLRLFINYLQQCGF